MKNQMMGEYNHTMDTKGRLIVPAKFREAGGDRFVVTKGLEKCLFLFTEEKWDAVFTAYCPVDKVLHVFNLCT